MTALLSRCRIGCQIALPGLIGVFGVLAVAGINWWGAGQLARSEATANTDEFSVEAGQAGVYATQVLDTSKRLNVAVDDLRHTVVRTVRTSVAEVDRRSAQRFPVNTICRIEAPGQGPLTARVADVSEGGARLIEAPILPTGSSGTLRFDRLATPISFRVVESNEQQLRVVFDPTAPEMAALRGLLTQAAPRAAAA